MAKRYSRLDRRMDAFGDLNTVGLQFLGGEGNSLDMCPLDRIVMAYCNLKEVSEVFKLDDK